VATSFGSIGVSTKPGQHQFVRAAWGYGYATESAKAALRHATRDVGLSEIVSYTSPDNRRSQAVMARLNSSRPFA